MFVAQPYENDNSPQNQKAPAKKASTTTTVLHQEQRLRSHLQYYANRGRQYHSKGAIKLASQAFSECIRISKQLLLSPNYSSDELSGIELLFMASHNMAACCNQLRSASLGEKILRELYAIVVELCETEHYPRELRLDALAVLDKSLFSLASQMAYMGKLASIRQLIDGTESFAERISKEMGAA